MPRIAVILLFVSQAALAQTLSVLPSAMKVRPQQQGFPAAQAAEVSAAKNEFEAFQLVIAAGASAMTGVKVQLASQPMTGPGGATIPRANVRLYQEEYYTASVASNAEGASGRWADPLIPEVDELYNETRSAPLFSQGLTIPAGENRVAFVEILVPANAPAGLYTTTLSVSWNGGSQSLPVSVNVWDFELPSTSSLVSSFTVFGDNLCRAHHPTGSTALANCLANANESQAQLRVLYGKFFLDHRITLDLVYPYATYNWPVFESVYAPYFDGTAGTRLTGAKPTAIQFKWQGWPEGNYSTTAAQAAHQDWWNKFASKGWASRTFDKICDEPGTPASQCQWSEIPARVAIVHAASPGFRTLVTQNIAEAREQADAGVVGFPGDFDILAPVVNHMDDKPGYTLQGNQRASYDALLSASSSNGLWWYQSCVSHGCGGPSTDPYFTGWPSYMVDAPTGFQHQAQEWLSFIYDVSGEHYFEVAMNLPTAWTDMTVPFGGHGDGTLVYPGTVAPVTGGSSVGIGGQHDVPVASYRLKMIRDGMESYEYLKLLSNLGDAAFARATAQGLFRPAASQPYHPYNSTLASAQALASARSALATRILQLLAPPPAGLSQSFEQGLPNDWSLSGLWRIATEGEAVCSDAFIGTHSVVFNYKDVSSPAWCGFGSDDIFTGATTQGSVTTARFRVPDRAGVTLSFWHWSQTLGSTYRQVGISTDSVQYATLRDWNQAYDCVPDESGSEGSWVEERISLEGYRGQDVRLRFFLSPGWCYEFGYRRGWFIDEVKVQ